MKRSYLMDTGIAQDYQSKRRGIREQAIALRRLGHRIGICVPVLGELWGGVEYSATREKNLVKLRRAVAGLIVWPYTVDAAEEYGRIFAELRRAGRPIQQVDMQIGAIARTLRNCVVVSKDSDLSSISGIVVENWSMPQ